MLSTDKKGDDRNESFVSGGDSGQRWLPQRLKATERCPAQGTYSDRIISDLKCFFVKEIWRVTE
jgi:hypothetical protein